MSEVTAITDRKDVTQENWDLGEVRKGVAIFNTKTGETISMEMGPWKKMQEGYEGHRVGGQPWGEEMHRMRWEGGKAVVVEDIRAAARARESALSHLRAVDSQRTPEQSLARRWMLKGLKTAGVVGATQEGGDLIVGVEVGSGEVCNPHCMPTSVGVVVIWRGKGQGLHEEVDRFVSAADRHCKWVLIVGDTDDVMKAMERMGLPKDQKDPRCPKILDYGFGDSGGADSPCIALVQGKSVKRPMKISEVEAEELLKKVREEEEMDLLIPSNPYR